MENDGSGLVRLTLRTVDETDAGRYRLKIRNSEGEAACEADLTYECKWSKLLLGDKVKGLLVEYVWLDDEDIEVSNMTSFS